MLLLTFHQNVNVKSQFTCRNKNTISKIGRIYFPYASGKELLENVKKKTNQKPWKVSGQSFILIAVHLDVLLPAEAGSNSLRLPTGDWR